MRRSSAHARSSWPCEACGNRLDRTTVAIWLRQVADPGGLLHGEEVQACDRFEGGP